MLPCVKLCYDETRTSPYLATSYRISPCDFEVPPGSMDSDLLDLRV